MEMNYIEKLMTKLNTLYPIGKRLLQDEKTAFFSNNTEELRRTREESNTIWAQIRRTEEALMIAKSVGK